MMQAILFREGSIIIVCLGQEPSWQMLTIIQLQKDLKMTYFSVSQRQHPQKWLFCIGIALLTFALILSSWLPSLAATQIDIVGPAGSGSFGYSFTILPNGNMVVVDPLYDIPGGASDVGAVHLYNGATTELISTLSGSTTGDGIGSGGVTILANGNFVVSSPSWTNGNAAHAGAVTWGSATSGVNGVVSSSNSLVGTHADDMSATKGIVALKNGNYVVINPLWDNGVSIDAGAVTWGNGSSGIRGAVSILNSLVGKSSGAQVGSGGVTELFIGNYVVQSPKWPSKLAPNYGAVTWGNGNTGVSGAVLDSNSLVGSKEEDSVGSNGVVALPNGNYLVSSPLWDRLLAADAGAVTWGNGATGISGPISSGNSLVGSTTNDRVGYGATTVLSNNNYVVHSRYWSNGSASNAGAATWGSGNTGISGEVSSNNSLVGSSAGDQVGGNGSTALSNGNYVVVSPSWKSSSGASAGAVTWANGTTGISGVVQDSNSLIGASIGDVIGIDGVVALTNGNYVVLSSQWRNGSGVRTGAVTWGNGATGTVGIVSSDNSLVGSQSEDHVGSLGSVTPMSNGNYLVRSPDWNSGLLVDAGAVTWGNGDTGTKGFIDSINSLVGSQSGDKVGSRGVALLTNGNYLVHSPYWDNGLALDAGAVTFGTGTIGVMGMVNPNNSLVGSHKEDGVGSLLAAVLKNGNYVLKTPYWDSENGQNVSAVTWGNGTTGISGEINSSNSLIGTTEGDLLGYGASFSLPSLLNDSYYLVLSPFWDNGNIVDAGAATWVDASTGMAGVVNSNNSLIGSAPEDRVGAAALLLGDGNYMIFQQDWNNGNISKAGAITWGNGQTGVSGRINSKNSVMGKVPDAGKLMNGQFDTVNQQMVVSRPAENLITLFRLTPAEIDVTGKGVAIPDGDNSPVSNDGTDLGAKVVGSGSVAQSFTISNTGDGALTVNAITLSGAQAGDFSVSSFSAPKVLAPNSALTFTLNFAPSAVGLRTATVNIASDDSNENPYTFAVKGTGSQHKLTTATTGSGTGTITLSPAGGSYNHNTVVTVTAKADAGSTFAGWSGDCSGKGACSVTMTSAKSVTASFSKNGSDNTQKVYLPVVMK